MLARVALYSDQGTLTEVDQFLALYRGAKRILDMLAGEED